MSRLTGWFVSAALALVLAPAAVAQWAAQPGDTRRNAFGPPRDGKAKVCRGACGAGCPDSCFAEVVYECTGTSGLRRVTTYLCGTHQGCREHDDCLDSCSQDGLEKIECQTRCHEEAVDRYGFEAATAWARGGGPQDGPPITFEYTRDAPAAPEPVFRCPAGSRQECDGSLGRCVTSSGATLDPVFDSYAAQDGAMRISGLRAGRLCDGRVCEETAEIRITGEDSCNPTGTPAPCTRFGLEFDYRNADPSAPLECSTSREGGKEDFIGNLLVKGLEAMPEPKQGNGDEQPNGMRELLGVFKQVVESADTPEDVRISMAPLGADGKPIESQRVGTSPQAGPPSTPRRVDLPSSSGHLVVPMYQLADEEDTDLLVREIRCSHKGTPVLETVFRLRF